MKEGLFLLGAFLITFFMGFFICLGAFPYIISYEKAEDKEVFRWCVAFIVAFSTAIIICLIKK